MIDLSVWLELHWPWLILLAPLWLPFVVYGLVILVTIPLAIWDWMS